MYAKFEALEAGKRLRIENAAMREFASKGYDRASTNRMVEDAGIAKGLLFHYFRSKKQLFLYLYDRSVELVTREVYAGVDFGDTDFFSRLHAAQRVKLGLIRVYPGIMDFLKAAYQEDSEAVRAALEARNSDLLALNFQKIFEGVDASVFRRDLDKNLVLKTIAWAYAGFANTLMEPLRRGGVLEADYGPMLEAADGYAAFLKKCFYGPENM